MERLRTVLNIINNHIQNKRENKHIKVYDYIDYITCTLPASGSVKAYKEYKLTINYIHMNGNVNELFTISRVCNTITKESAIEEMIEEAGEYLLSLLESYMGEQIIHGTYEGMEK